MSGNSESQYGPVPSSSVYTSLSIDDEHTFRLLYIPPDSSGFVPHYQLVSQHIDTSVEYETLSYVWGTNNRTIPIQVNHGEIRVTQSLMNILQSLRLPTESRAIWIDQICINQDDVADRNAQIKLLTQIYSSSRRTLIWLSEGTAGTSRALEYVKSMLAYHSTMGAPESLPRFLGQTYANPENWRMVLKQYGNPATYLNPKTIYDITKILKAVWFDRTWTLQELVVSKGVLVKCGRDEIPWSDLWTFCDGMRRTKMAHVYLGGNHKLCLEVGNIRRQSSTNPADSSLNLLSLLVSRRKFKATDPKDKVYALLGISNDVKIGDIVPDYRKSLREIFTEATAIIIHKTKPVNILSHIELQRQKDLPSWVPDWDSDSGVSLLASRSDFPKLYYEGEMRAVVDKLVISGLAILPLQSVEPLRDNWTRHWDRHFEAIRPYCTRPYPITGEPYEEAYLSALSPGSYSERIDRAKTMYRYGGSLARFLQQGPVAPTTTEAAVRKGFGRTTVYSTRTLTSRAFLVTAHGMMGVGPQNSQPGDVICMLSHSTTLHVLRRLQGDNIYAYIGQCIVYGLMDGEAVDSDTEWTKFILV